jgi:hypothetical protein
MNATVTRQMIGAEILKLRRKRGIMIWAALLLVGTSIVYYAVAEILHLSDPGNHGPAGGATGFTDLLSNTGMFTAAMAAILVGVTAGGADVSSGVFRDLAATGRSRLSLFLVRIPGALAVILPMAAASLAVALAGSYIFAGGLATPDAGTIAQYSAWFAASTAFSLILAIGVSSVTSSRAIAVGSLMAWQLALAYLVSQLSFLRGLREGISVNALANLLPSGVIQTPVSSSVGVAIAVLLVWSAIAIGAGAWRTRVMDA